MSQDFDSWYGNPIGNIPGTLGFDIETANYYPYDDTRAEVPESWKPYLHPNQDVYYYNSGMRLLSTDDIRDPVIRGNVLEVRNDYYETLVDDGDYLNLAGDWVMTITDCTEESANVGVHSRTMGQSFELVEDKGLVPRPREHFWAFFAEYPTHDKTIPEHLENEFVQALVDAQEGIKNGTEYPLDASQMEQVIRRYNFLKAHQNQGKEDATAALAWLMGAVMPLDPLPAGSQRSTRRLSNHVPGAFAKAIHFN